MGLRFGHASREKKKLIIDRSLHARGANCAYWVDDFVIFIVYYYYYCYEYWHNDTSILLNQTSFTVIVSVFTVTVSTGVLKTKCS